VHELDDVAKAGALENQFVRVSVSLHQILRRYVLVLQSDQFIGERKTHQPLESGVVVDKASVRILREEEDVVEHVESLQANVSVETREEPVSTRVGVRSRVAGAGPKLSAAGVVTEEDGGCSAYGGGPT
jgi:hypothetical protein